MTIYATGGGGSGNGEGTCNWVDYVGLDGRTVRDVAWVYPKVKPGHESIQGRYGFYAGSRGATREESCPP